MLELHHDPETLNENMIALATAMRPLVFRVVSAVEQLTWAWTNAARQALGYEPYSLEEFHEALLWASEHQEAVEIARQQSRANEARDLTRTAAIYGFREARVVWLEQEEQFIWIAGFYCGEWQRIGAGTDAATRWIRQQANEA